jgi:hypothetical protein
MEAMPQPHSDLIGLREKDTTYEEGLQSDTSVTHQLFGRWIGVESRDNWEFSEMSNHIVHEEGKPYATLESD